MSMIRRIHFLVFLAVAFVCVPWHARAADDETIPVPSSAEIANVVSFGADADGVTSDNEAFDQAIHSGLKVISVPAGKYLIGPDEIDLPEGVTLRGEGSKTVLVLSKGQGTAFRLAKDVKISSLSIDGKKEKTGGMTDAVIMLPKNADGCTVEKVRFNNCDRACIVTDHAGSLLIRDCVFDHVGAAISLQFSHNVKILDNSVDGCRIHGIQFWGNWQWQTKDCSDILISGNTVKNGGSGAIWGNGGVRITMTHNVVQGAKDVGLDLEWCDDSTISDNTASGCRNGGIALFYSCKHISITGNTVNNDAPVPDTGAQPVLAGIWLTDPDTSSFKGDVGHEDIAITGNTIDCVDGNHKAMLIGYGSDNVRVSNNTVSGADAWYKENVNGTVAQRKISGDTVISRAGNSQ